MDPAATFLLETLKDEIVSTSKNLGSVRNQITNLRNDLSYFKGVLENWTENPIEDRQQKELVKQLRETVYEAEDILADFIAQEINYKSMNTFRKLTHRLNHPKKLLFALNKFESMREKLEQMHQRKMLGSTIGPKPKMDPTVEEENVVGFDGEAKTVIDILANGTDDLEVISITGMPGLGKTTLAKMIFRNSTIEYAFYNRVWVYVSKDCNVKEVFIQILGHFTKVTGDMRDMSDKDLSREVYRYLEREKYLIVLDDVWEQRDWDSLKYAFPKNKNNSKILITCRNEVVARYANPNRIPHKLKFLTQEESCKLLNLKALGSEECPYEDLVTPGNIIAQECRGLPLAIVVIGGILRGKGTETQRWIDVSKNVKGYINMDPEQTKDKFIAWSFYQLPYSLKACLLYLGMFPEDSLISVRKLILMWIAEGFIEQNRDMNLEDIAEKYLEDLVKRNLVIVGELRSNGKIKTCHVHGVIRSFCMEIAAEENLYHEVKQFDPSTYLSSNPEFQTYRRICICSRVLDYLNSENLVSPRLHSFSCSSTEEITLHDTQINCIPKMFKLLRVLDAKPISFPTFPRELPQLVHLRYLVLSIKFKILPETISNLWNLQTLIVHTTSRTLEIKGDSLKMLKLRHLETNASTTWLAISKARNRREEFVRNENLMTLSTISPETCTEDVFDQVPNLNKLGIRGQLSKILNRKDSSCSFDNLMTLRFLKNLKLINDVSNFESEIIGLPDRFPPYVKKLTLTSTQLDWSHMSTLGKLENLEILKLKENAFKGKLWEPKYGEFPALKVLHIGRTDLVFWEASKCHFTRLRRLSINHCTYLREIQLGLGNISSLETVALSWTTTSAVASVKKIQKRTDNGKGFKLLVYPPDHDQ